MSAAEPLPPSAGVYALVWRLVSPLRLEVGRLGRVDLPPGWALYVGSAHGPGGLAARVGRHLRAEKRTHWHVDALTGRAPVCAVWAVESARRLECAWAGAIMGLAGVSIPVPGFGSSDCRCPTHLFHLPDLVTLIAARRALRRASPPGARFYVRRVATRPGLPSPQAPPRRRVQRPAQPDPDRVQR
jgi:Uri superfamily endonuclease